MTGVYPSQPETTGRNFFHVFMYHQMEILIFHKRFRRRKGKPSPLTGRLNNLNCQADNRMSIGYPADIPANIRTNCLTHSNPE